MAQEFKIVVDERLNNEASAEFCHAYGLAMAEWSSVEYSLYHWFAHLTHMKDAMARAVFYSARSFNGRAEMLDAAISTADDTGKNDLKFIKAALKKAWSYSGFRNNIAHGQPFLNLHLSGPRDKPTHHGAHYEIIQAKSVSSPTITMAELGIATTNFSDLATISANAAPQLRDQDCPTIEESLVLILRLPNEANSKISPIDPGHPQRPKGDHASRVNKKSHRASQQAAKDRPKTE